MATYTMGGLTGTFTQVAAGALVTTPFFEAPVACTLSSINISWGTAAGAASTWDITKDGSGTAPGAGTSVLASAIDANGTANTPLVASLTTGAPLSFAAGDRLSIKVASGAATGSAKVVATAHFVRA